MLRVKSFHWLGLGIVFIDKELIRINCKVEIVIKLMVNEEKRN